MDRPGVRQVPEGSGEQRKMEETGCEVIWGAPTTIAVKGWVKVKILFFTVGMDGISSLHMKTTGGISTILTCNHTVNLQ